ncbi:MAG: UMP kinase [Candidatus Bathyarchaeia archaeon]|jgi:uridylate kinase
MKVSISLGGSLLTRNMDAASYRRYAEVVKRLWEAGHTVVVTCGGGRPARQFITIAKELDANCDIQDSLGILATHVNALLLIAALGDAADPHIHQRSTDIKRHFGDKILVGGGYKPGSSTDYRAAIFAEAINADLIINATDVAGVYDKNPKTNQDAKKLDTLTYPQLENIIRANTRQSPGEYGLFDLKAVRLAAKLGIPLIFVDGTDPEEIIRAVTGAHHGTVVRP